MRRIPESIRRQLSFRIRFTEWFSAKNQSHQDALAHKEEQRVRTELSFYASVSRNTQTDLNIAADVGDACIGHAQRMIGREEQELLRESLVFYRTR